MFRCSLAISRQLIRDCSSHRVSLWQFQCCLVRCSQSGAARCQTHTSRGPTLKRERPMQSAHNSCLFACHSCCSRAREHDLFMLSSDAPIAAFMGPPPPHRHKHWMFRCSLAISRQLIRDCSSHRVSLWQFQCCLVRCSQSGAARCQTHTSRGPTLKRERPMQSAHNSCLFACHSCCSRAREHIYVYIYTHTYYIL